MEYNELVSVIIPCYNHEKYIVDCLESVKAQTYKNIEVIICDDCSTDNSFDVINDWISSNSKSFSNCVCFKNETNLGITRTLNSMIKKSKGSYIKIIASDDLLMSDAVERMVSYLNKNEKEDIVFSNMYDIDESTGFPINSRLGKLHFRNKPVYGEGIFEDIFRINTISAPSVLFRRKTFDLYGLFDEELLFEDWEYWLRIEINEGCIGYIDEPLVAYRVSNQSASHFGKKGKNNQRQIKAYESNACMLKKYAKYSQKGLDYFYNISLQSALQSMNSELVDIVMKEGFTLRLSSRIMLIQYRLKLFFNRI